MVHSCVFCLEDTESLQEINKFIGGKHVQFMGDIREPMSYSGKKGGVKFCIWLTNLHNHKIAQTLCLIFHI